MVLRDCVILWNNIHLEAGCDGGKLVVCRFWVPDKVVPAGEHLPAEVKTGVVSTTLLISIAGHPVGVKQGNECRGQMNQEGSTLHK